MQSAQSREDLSFTEPLCKNFIYFFKLKLVWNIIHKILTVYFANLHIGHSAGGSSGSCLAQSHLSLSHTVSILWCPCYILARHKPIKKPRHAADKRSKLSLLLLIFWILFLVSTSFRSKDLWSHFIAEYYKKNSVFLSVYYFSDLHNSVSRSLLNCPQPRFYWLFALAVI